MASLRCTTYILRTSTYALDILKKNPHGTLHSAYRRAVNLRFGEYLLALQCQGSPLSPLSLITNMDEEMLSALTEDEITEVIYQDGQLVLMSNCRVLMPVKMAESIDVQELHLPSIEENDNHRISRELRAALTSNTTPDPSIFRHLLSDCIPGEMVDQAVPRTLSLTEEFLLPRLQSILSAATTAIKTNNYELSAENLVRLIGLGGGLTPAGDDFLCGCLAGLELSGKGDHPLTEALRREILLHLKDTNEISAAFLACACEGEFSEAVLFAARGAEAWDVLSAFDAIGHSSGWDTLWGIMYGMK